MSIILKSPSVQHDFGRGPHWYHESPFLPFADSEETNLGSSSLKDTATRRLFKDQSDLKPELFENVPWKISEELWAFLGHRGKQTLLMWKILSMRYPEQFPQVSPSYCLRTWSPKTPLKGYIDILRSDACHWRAILSLSNYYAHQSDLVDIGTLKNLVALEIIQGRKPSSSIRAEALNTAELEDGVVRSWLESAQSTGSLQHLQVLRIYRQKFLTHHVLSMLEKLPRLNLVVIYGCERITQELGRHKTRTPHGLRVAGWRAQRWDWISDGRQKTEKLQFLGPLSQVYENGFDSENKDQTLDSNLPILEFGLPRLDCDNHTIELAKAQYAGNSIIICTRVTERKDRKRASQENLRPQNTGKRKMKERGGKGMADVLGDFLWM